MKHNTTMIDMAKAAQCLLLEGLDGALEKLGGFATDPMARVAKFRVSREMYEGVKSLVAGYKKAKPGPFEIAIESNAFVPPGYVLGFSAKNELVLMIGPPIEPRTEYTARDKLDDLAGCHQWRHDGKGYTP